MRLQRLHQTRPRCCLFVIAAAVLVGLLTSAWAEGMAAPPDVDADGPAYRATKTPYVPRQDPRTHSLPPEGFVPIHTQLLARHGSRGLSNPGADLIAYAAWTEARGAGALTPLGSVLGEDLVALMRANALLGYGAPGVRRPGYGNLTGAGRHEHRELGARMAKRLPGLFAADKPTGEAARQRAVAYVTSGIDRATDSATAFVEGLHSALPPGARPTILPWPVGERGRPAGVDRYLLYFHALDPTGDRVDDQGDPRFTTYRRSLAYQAYRKAEDVQARVRAARAAPALESAARRVLLRLFSARFVDEIASGARSFTPVAELEFASDDGRFRAGVAAPRRRTAVGVVDVAMALYELYSIAPALREECAADFDRYFAPEDARAFAEASDAEDFYEKGPGLAERAPVTYAMAGGLLESFLAAVEVAARGTAVHVATLRFTHAEVVIPFATLLGIAGADIPVAAGAEYSYATNPWRGERLAPMAANIQWDAFADGAGTVILRMLYNERETDFASSCEVARWRPGSRFYDLARLVVCYRAVLAALPAKVPAGAAY